MLWINTGGKILGDIWGYETVGMRTEPEEMDKHLANGGTPNWGFPRVQVTSCMAISTVKMVLTTAQPHTEQNHSDLKGNQQQYSLLQLWFNMDGSLE